MWHHKILPTRNGRYNGWSEREDMKTKRIFSIIGLILTGLSPVALAAGHGGGGGGGGGGFGSTFSGGGHFGGGAPAARSGGRGFSAGRPAYFYSRGMHYGGPRTGQMRSPIQQSHSPARITTTPTTNRTSRGIADTAQRTPRATLNGRTDNISERHSAANWHNDWDRRHSHFFHNRFFVFDDGFWFGLDPGFFPWDYYPYYAYDYYPYDYYPGYYADVEPYYYDEGVYSETPMQDPTVSAVQKELTQLGYYSGPVDGIYGPTTRDAVAKYQIAKNLDVNGSLSAQTLQSLGLPQPAAS